MRNLKKLCIYQKENKNKNQHKILIKIYQTKGANTRRGEENIKEKKEKEPQNYDNVYKQNQMKYSS